MRRTVTAYLTPARPMTRKPGAVLALVIASLAGLFALPPVTAARGASRTPAGARDPSGGGGLNGGQHKKRNPGGVQNGDYMVSATGPGGSIATHASGFLYQSMGFSGRIPSAPAGTRLEIERAGTKTNWRWVPTVSATTVRGGYFGVNWYVNHIGRFEFRVVLVRSGQVAAASPAVTATLFRNAIATWYGPGFWGATTACGEVLRPNTLGVANRTLPCGTRVDIYYHGKTITVPVIDRGPYANGADWDLTEATANALGMSQTETIGAVSL